MDKEQNTDKNLQDYYLKFCSKEYAQLSEQLIQES